MNEFGDKLLKDTYHLSPELQFISSPLSPTICIHIGKDKEVIYHTLEILFYLFFFLFFRVYDNLTHYPISDNKGIERNSCKVGR